MTLPTMIQRALLNLHGNDSLRLVHTMQFSARFGVQRAAALVLKEGFPENPVAVTVVGTTGFALEAPFRARRPDPAYQPNPFHATAVPVGTP
jgi:hypothetical protein